MMMWKVRGHACFDSHGREMTVYSLTDDSATLPDVDASLAEATRGLARWGVILEVRNLGSIDSAWVKGENDWLDAIAAAFEDLTASYDAPASA